MNIEDLEGLNEATKNEIKELLKITRDNSGNELFAATSFLKGKILYDNGYIETAIESWQEIDINDSSEIYSDALFEIGVAMIAKLSNKGLDIKDIDPSIRVWQKILHEYSPNVYAKAQHAIMLMYCVKGDLNSALYALEKLNIEDCLVTFSNAHYQFGKELIERNFDDLNIIIQAFANSKELYPYESSCYMKICELLRDKQTVRLGRLFLQLFNEVLNIFSILELNFDTNLEEGKAAERKLAHYTSTDTAKMLLGADNKSRSLSSFRLNTVSNVNDPSEGFLLKNYLGNIKENNFKSLELNQELHAFISCFTLNHDSLNQFRLYGKKDHAEASGVSLVFKKEFFQSNKRIGGLQFLSVNKGSRTLSQKLTEKRLPDVLISYSQNEKITKVDRLPIMRCVYLDPVSGFLQLAQRNKITFYREFSKKEKEENSIAEQEWKKYKKMIDNKTIDFNLSFKQLENIHKCIMEEKKSTLNSDTTDEILNEVFLPLKYLIKHSAFQEEQECRMVYITSLNDNKVKMDFGKFLYVEYEAEVKKHLDKIYIAPAATQFQPYLAKLLCDTDVKIELSNNPYRHT